MGMLCDLGAATNTKDEQGWTALHLAARQNNVKASRALLAHGRAHVDARDSQGRTPLYLAVELGYQMVARILLHFGAKTSVVDAGGAMLNTKIKREVKLRSNRGPHKKQTDKPTDVA